MSERQTIVVEDVLEMLRQGKTRDEIGTHYGLNGVDLKKLFQHPQLKGRRTHKEPSFIVVSRAESSVEVGGSNEGAMPETSEPEMAQAPGPIEEEGHHADAIPETVVDEVAEEQNEPTWEN